MQYWPMKLRQQIGTCRKSKRMEQRQSEQMGKSGLMRCEHAEIETHDQTPLSVKLKGWMRMERTFTQKSCSSIWPCTSTARANGYGRQVTNVGKGGKQIDLWAVLDMAQITKHPRVEMPFCIPSSRKRPTFQHQCIKLYGNTCPQRPHPGKRSKIQETREDPAPAEIS